MKQIFIILSAGLLLFSGCKNDNELPEGIVSEAKMVELLEEIFMAENRLVNLKLNRDTTIAIFETYEQLIFEKHQIDPEQYKASLTYYYDHTDKLEAIYETLLDSLNVKESKLKSKLDAQRQKQDSLARQELLKSKKSVVPKGN